MLVEIKKSPLEYDFTTVINILVHVLALDHLQLTLTSGNFDRWSFDKNLAIYSYLRNDFQSSPISELDATFHSWGARLSAFELCMAVVQWSRPIQYLIDGLSRSFDCLIFDPKLSR